MDFLSTAAAFYGVAVTAALHLALGLGAAGIPLICGAGGMRTVKPARIFMNKFGQQSCTFALLGGGYVFLVLAAAAALLKLRLPEVALFWFTAPFPLYPLAASLLLGVAAFLAYRGLWQKMKNNKRVHSCIGVFSALCFWVFLYCAAATLRLFAAKTDIPAEALRFFIPDAASLFWPAVIEGAAAALSLGGGFCAVNLLLRRNKDDFGRDYYNHTLRYAARWALFAGIPMLGAQVWLICAGRSFAAEHAAASAVQWTLGGAGACLAASLLLWSMVAFQPNALRFKGMVASAWILSLAAVCLQTTGQALFSLG